MASDGLFDHDDGRSAGEAGGPRRGSGHEARRIGTGDIRTGDETKVLWVGSEIGPI